MSQIEKNREFYGEDFIGWCMYCKETVSRDEKIRRKKDKIYHLDCWKILHDEVDELKFYE